MSVWRGEILNWTIWSASTSLGSLNNHLVNSSSVTALYNCSSMLCSAGGLDFLNNIPDPTYQLIWLFMAAHWRDFRCPPSTIMQKLAGQKWLLNEAESNESITSLLLVPQQLSSVSNHVCLHFDYEFRKTFEGFEMFRNGHLRSIF